MPNRESQKYTRYVNDPQEDFDDEERQIAPDGVVELEDYDRNQMQEGRRVLAMMTPRSPQNGGVCTRAEYGKIIVVAILLTAICFGGGVLFGFTLGNKSSDTSASVASQPCLSILNHTSTTTSTTTPPNWQPDSPALDPFFEEPDIPSMTSHFLSHFTPELLKMFAGNISSIRSDNVRKFIRKTLEPHGFVLEERAFPVMSSMADKKLPNTVEILMKNKSVVLINNATESLKDFHPFSGFSSNGTAYGKTLVYANYGSKEDFLLLKKMGINLSSSIALIRLCDNVHPGAQVLRASAQNVTGVILFPDPKNFGEWNNNPRNDSLPPDGVVWQNLRMVPGDPSTPLYASQKDVFRTSPINYSNVYNEKVQPISSSSALELLKTLGGSEVPDEWKGSLNVTYRFGGTFNDNEIEAVRIVINNVVAETFQHVTFAYLPAKDHSKVIQIGCHYDIKDSHITSSGIGLAGLLALGSALKTTYPNGTERLIVLSAFEGLDGDFSVGSEFSQLYSWWVESTTLAYVDMDAILEGKGFAEANVSPILRKLVKEALEHVPWVGKEGLTAYQGLTSAIPSHLFTTVNNKQLFQESFAFKTPYECDESVNFLNVHGIPSLQLTAISINKSQNFHLRNSQYDTMELIQKLEDTDLHWSHMIVSVMGVSVLLLACTPLPSIRFDDVGWSLSNEWKTFIAEEKALNISEHPAIMALSERISAEFDKFVLTTESYDAWYKDGKIREGLTPYQIFRNVETRLVRFQQFGRRFLRPRNAPGSTPFGSHLIYGPSIDDPCAGTYFPFIKSALNDAIKYNASWDSLQEEMSLLLSSLMDIRTDA